MGHAGLLPDEHVDDDDWAGELKKLLPGAANRSGRMVGVLVKDKPEIGQIFVNGTDEGRCPQAERRAPPHQCQRRL